MTPAVGRARRITVGGRKVITGPPPAPETLAAAQRCVLAAGTKLRRIYWPEPHKVTATSFRFHGPSARFDQQRRPAPFPAADDDPERGIFYGAQDFECCVAECFGDDGVIDPTGAMLAVLKLARDLPLLDLRAGGAMKAGAVDAVAADGDRQVTQDWGRYWYEHPELTDLHGLVFSGSHTSQDAVAVWERADGSFEVLLDKPLDDPTVMPDLLVVARDLELPIVQ